nr:MAG: hypothetical protein J07AB56_03490 [Candidatus Nanosalinarum sp. J07AB56]
MKGLSPTTTSTPLVGATVESEDGALTATNETGQYTLQTTSNDTTITADAFGHANATKEVNSSGTVDFALEEQLELDLVQGQPAATEIGGQFDIEADVGSLDNLTVSLNDSTTFRVTDNEVTVTLTTESGDTIPIPLGETVDVGGYTGPATITVSVYQGADIAAGDQLVLDHEFGGAGDTQPVTTGPTTFVNSGGVAESVSIDADFVGVVNDQSTTTVTAEGLVNDGVASDGDKVTFTIGGEPVATATTADGTATAEVTTEQLEAAAPAQDVEVDIVEFTALETDTVDLVDEVADLEQGFNLISVPQPATVSTQDVSSLNVWDSETGTYEAVTSPEFDTASDLHDGIYVAADSDTARIGFSFNTDVPVGGTQDVNSEWNLLGSNFPLDSVDIGTAATIENDLTGVNATNLELFRGDFEQFLTPQDEVGPFEAYWAFNPAGADQRGIASPAYDETDRRSVLGQGDSDFQPEIINSELTSIEDAESQTLLEDTSVIGASEQVLLVDVEVENNGTGEDVQFVDLSVTSPVTLGGVSLEQVDQTGVELAPGESEVVTLSFVASADETQGDGFVLAEDIFFEVTTEDGADDFGSETPSAGGVDVEDQALTSDGEFVVDNVDIADHGTVQLVDATDTVLDSVEFSQGINRQVVFDDFSRANVTETVTVKVLEDDQSDATDQLLVEETVTVQDTLIDVTNNAPAFALVGDVTEIPVLVENNARLSEDDEITFSAGGSQLDSRNVSLAGGETTAVTFGVEPQALGLGVGDTVDHTAASSDDSDTQTLTIANASLSFNDQTLNTTAATNETVGTVVVEDVTASADQKVVVTDTDFDIKGEVAVDTAINGEDVTVAVNTTAGAHVAHVVSETTDVSSAGPGLVSQQATVATVAIDEISNKTIDEESLPNTVTDEVTVNINAGAQSETFTVEIANEAGDVIGNATTDTTGAVTVSLDEPVIKNDTAPETVVLDATLVGADGAEFDRPDANDGFQPFSDQESFEVTVAEASANVALPDQALGTANVTRETGGDGVSADNVVITIDLSGSMCGTKFRMRKMVLKNLLGLLRMEPTLVWLGSKTTRRVTAS